MITTVITVMFLLPAVLFAVCSLYLVVLLVAALCGAMFRKRAQEAESIAKLVAVIPAHDEEKVLARTLESLQQCDYPRDAYEIVVVADNCTDCTADVARTYGVTVLERENLSLRGKGYALDYFITQYLAGREDVDAAIIVDADSVVTTNLFRAVNGCVARGYAAGQVRDTGDNPAEGWRPAMQFISLALKNHVRALGRQTLGYSAGLFGNGMFFSRRLLVERGWPAKSIVEDAEFAVSLGLDGVKICYAPEAEVRALMPVTDSAGQIQKGRWEFGQWQLARRSALPLLRTAARRCSFEPVLWCLDLVTPPLVTFFVANGVILLCALVLLFVTSTWPALVLCVVSGLAVGGLVIYAVVGLLLSRAPRAVWGSLFMLPVYTLWKIRFYARLWTKGGPTGWARTDRN